MKPTTMQRYVLKQLENGEPINGYLIQLLLEDFAPISRKKKDLYDRYTIANVPIQNRNLPESTKINNKLNNDYVGEIIDTKIGYLLGHPIKYQLDKNEYQGLEQQYKDHQGFINKFIVRNNANDLDIELGKLVSICGVAGREVYIDLNGNERMVNLYPWETIFLTNIHGEVQYALRFWQELRTLSTINNNGYNVNSLQEITCVEWFDSESVTYFIQGIMSDNNLSFILDEDRPMNPKPHVFGICPVVKVVNNEEEMGDVERVLELIDAVDRTTSDINSEIEQFRLAYMYFKGEEPTQEMIDNARQTGGFYVGADGEVGFITKSINDVAVENHLDRLEANIVRFAKHVKLSDQHFGNNLSGVAIKYKLMALENKSQITEVKMKTALLRQFEILTSAWSKKGFLIDYLSIFFDFTRNLPVNLVDEADITMKLKGLVSERTRLSQLSFVDDVYYEMQQMNEDVSTVGESLLQEGLVGDRVNINALNNIDTATTDGYDNAKPSLNVGDRVQVVGNHPMVGTKGTISMVNGSAYGVVFDGMATMGVHQFYNSDQLQMIANANTNQSNGSYIPDGM